jgi:hypothetical protein
MSRPALSWRTLIVVAVTYTACVLLATYPVVRTFASHFPGSLADPLQALRVMRWYKEALFHRQSLLLCRGLQYPIGAPLGNFSPMQFQALLYLPLSLVVGNDVLCYNLIWLGNLVFTGLGTFVLIWYVCRDRTCAWFGGLLALLSGPMMLHAFGHLELISQGWFPLFLVGWMRWLEQPTWPRLFAAAGLYLLVALSAAYFAVLAIVPALLYLVWHLLHNRRAGFMLWLRSRGVPLLAFMGLVLPVLGVLFFNQLWSRFHGYALARPREEFFHNGAPLWSCVVPTAMHRLGGLLPADLYQQAGVSPIETCSYLGVVTLLLIGYALLSRAPFWRARYWWALFAVLLLLSLGAGPIQVGNFRIWLPGAFLYNRVFFVRMMRVPARFNLLLIVCAALLAAVGLRGLLNRFKSRVVRGVAVAGLALAALADLAIVPYPVAAMPEMPPCYALLQQRDPKGTFLEVPQYSTSWGVLNGACTYWQGLHHGTTTAGCSGFDNIRWLNEMFYPSPFAFQKLVGADYWLDATGDVAVDLVGRTDFLDYAWVYLAYHRLDYVILHQDAALTPCLPALDRMKALLQGAKIFEDGRTIVYDSTRLPVPRQPVLLAAAGWGLRCQGWYQDDRFMDRPISLLSPRGRLAVYNPDADRPLTLHLEGVALHVPRTVRLLAGERELACWRVAADGLHTYASPPFTLPAGMSEVVLESDGAERPKPLEEGYPGDRTPYSLRVAAVSLQRE